MPGLVKTPLWTDNPDKLKMIIEPETNTDQWVYPEEVAKVMLALVKDNEIDSKIKTGGGDKVTFKGGSCIEVMVDFVRDVPMHNNVGPAAMGASAADKMYEETLDRLKPGWGAA